MAIGDEQWEVAKPAGTDLISSIDGWVGDNNKAVQRLIGNTVNGCVLSYVSSSSVTIGAGSLACTNGALFRFRENTSTVTATFSSPDASSWYNIFAVADSATATTFTAEAVKVGGTPSGTYLRRVGSVYIDGSQNVTQFSSFGNGLDKYYYWDTFQNVRSGSIAGVAGWEDVDMSAAMPPTSRLGLITVAGRFGGNTGFRIYMRTNGISENTLTENTHAILEQKGNSSNPDEEQAVRFWQPTDASQIVEVQAGNGTGANVLYISVVGYMDSI
jgi:hypothetical protein